MTKYRESNTTGEAWRRANKVIIKNELDAVPSISFEEENIFVLASGQAIKERSDNIHEMMTANNLGESFALVNPQTGDPIPGAASTYQDVQVLLHSLYLHLAAKRDAGPQ